jgi:hypothetical protein
VVWASLGDRHVRVVVLSVLICVFVPAVWGANLSIPRNKEARAFQV